MGLRDVTLTVREERLGAWWVLRVEGELDLVSAPTVRRRVHDAVAEGRRDLIIDLGGVRFCDSTGVGVLIAARRLLRSCAGRLRIILPPEAGGEGSHVNRVLAALGVLRLFEHYPDPESAARDAAEPLPT
nr:STAS domain-containing protein [Streptomyces alkaliphilus]